jgi:hypothetical protein
MHMRELVDLVAQFDETLIVVRSVTAAFSLEDGPRTVGKFLDRVEVRRYSDRLEVTDVDALCAYVLSASSVFQLPAERREALDAFIRSRMANMGRMMSITKNAGMILAR